MADFDVRCQECGGSLNAEWNWIKRCLEVEFCEDCGDERFEDGKAEGEEEGDE